MKLDGARPLVRQQCDPLDRIGQPVALEFDVLVVGFGNDPLVSRKLTVDHSRDQRSLANVEEKMILALLKTNFFVAFRQQTAEFTQRFLRQNWPFFIALLGLKPRDLIPVIAPL